MIDSQSYAKIEASAVLYMGRIKELKRKFKRYSQLTQVNEIARRYFVMNAYDGCLTILGIIVGAYFSALYDARVLIGVGLGSSIAMALSGLFGAYMTESAERRKKVQDLEKNLLTSLEDSIITRGSQFASLYVAFIDGLAPFLAAQLSLAPIYISLFTQLPVKAAMELSMSLIVILLFILGIYLGRLSKENLIISGLKMVLAGLITFTVFLVLGLF
ncbi:MAG: VIT1/CCC1 transporter family protein [Candidatus Ranarchaeia archaeon]